MRHGEGNEALSIHQNLIEQSGEVLMSWVLVSKK